MGSGAVITGELAKYFNKKFSVANTIARTGLSTGLIVMPLLIQLFIDVYGWRGTLLLVGGINLHCMVSGALLKPITASRNASDDGNEEFQLQSKQLNSNHLHYQPIGDDNCATIKSGEGSNETHLRAEPAQTASHEIISTGECQRQRSTIELGVDKTCPPVKSAQTEYHHIGTENCQRESSTLELGDDKTSVKSGQTEYHQINTDNCQRQRSTLELGVDKTSPVKSGQTPTNESTQQKQRKCALSWDQSLNYYLDLELQDSVFISRMVYISGCGYCNTGWLIYLVPFAVTLEIPPYEAASLATFGGVGQLFGTMIFPLLTRQLSNANILYLTSLLMCFALLLNPLFSILHSYAGLICSAVGFGLGRGSGLLANLQIAKENSAKSDKMTNVFTWLNVAYSVGSISSGFLSGK